MKRTLWIIVLIVFGMASSASALSLTYGLDTEFSGATAPIGAAPWVEVIFDDGDTPGSVRLTITNVGLSNEEFLSGFYFNVDNLSAITGITYVDTSAATINGFLLSEDTFKADGDGFFDLFIDLAPPPGSFPQKFTTGETLEFDFTGAGITAQSFDALSLGSGNSPDGLPVAAHIQGIDPNADNSGWITDGDGGDYGDGDDHPIIPEPGTAFLLLAGLLVMAAGLTRRKRS
jgi:hypothetical protein